MAHHKPRFKQAAPAVAQRLRRTAEPRRIDCSRSWRRCALQHTLHQRLVPTTPSRDPAHSPVAAHLAWAHIVPRIGKSHRHRHTPQPLHRHVVLHAAVAQLRHLGSEGEPPKCCNTSPSGGGAHGNIGPRLGRGGGVVRGALLVALLVRVHRLGLAASQFEVRSSDVVGMGVVRGTTFALPCPFPLGLPAARLWLEPSALSMNAAISAAVMEEKEGDTDCVRERACDCVREKE